MTGRPPFFFFYLTLFCFFFSPLISFFFRVSLPPSSPALGHQWTSKCASGAPMLVRSTVSSPFFFYFYTLTQVRTPTITLVQVLLSQLSLTKVKEKLVSVHPDTLDAPVSMYRCILLYIILWLCISDHHRSGHTPS